jgi:hypothetical protein
VTEADTRVPERVPQTIGDLVDVTAAVEQQDVDVALRRQLAPPVAPDGDDRDARLVTEELREPAVDEVRERPRERGPA